MTERFPMISDGAVESGLAPHILTAVAALLPVCIGVLVLLCWAGVAPLSQPAVAVLTTTQPTSAIAFVLCGIALAAARQGRKGLQRSAIAAVALLAVNALISPAYGLPIGQFLFPYDAAHQAVSIPGGMARVPAAEFILVSLTIALTVTPGRSWSLTFSAAATLGMVFAAISGVGHLFGAQRLPAFGSSAVMAVPTAVGFVFLFLGTLAVRPGRGWIWIFFRRGDLGATTARQLIVFVLGLPLVAGLAVHALLGWGPEVQSGFRLALAMTIIMAGLCVAVLRLCHCLSNADQKRQAADAALRTSEARLRAIVDTAVDAMLVVDEVGAIVHFNPAAQTIFGCGANSALGSDVFMLMAGPHPHDLPTFLATAGKRGMDGRREIVGRRKDGSRVPLDLSVAEWGDGDRRFFTWIMRDLTFRYATKQALKVEMDKLERAESMIDVALNVSGVALFGMDAQCRYLWARNNRVGIADAGIVGATPIQILEEGCAARLSAFYSGVLAKGGAANAEFELRRRDEARTTWVNIYARRVEGLDGRPELTCAAIDITAQKRGMAKLARSEARYRTIFSQAAVGLGQVALDGRLLAVNDKLCAMLGYSREELLLKTCEDITIPSFHEEERKLLAELTAGRIAEYFLEKQYVRRDGSPLWVRVSSSIPSEEGVRYRISIVEDISAQKQAMDHLAAAREEAEQASRAKSKFLAAASHDLRQPTQAMLLLISALDGMLGDHRARPVLDNMQTSLGALQGLLDALLDVSRLDAGIVVPSVRPVSVSALFDGLAAQYRLMAEEKGLDLRFFGSNMTLFTDPTLLERILRNLIENAIRYTRTGGLLVGGRRRAGRLLIQVVDTGIGIAPGHQQAVWEEFFQVGNPERDRAHGLGLGLAIVRRMVDLLGLRLTMKSALGKGTCFSLEVPLAADQALPRVHLPVRPARGGNGRHEGVVLVIDDEPMIRTGLGMVLARWGCEVKTVASGEEAVAWVRREGGRPEHIIADYRLAEGKLGTNAAREVQLACGRKVPTIIMTGDTAPERIAEAARSGFQIVHKPVAPERLRELILSTPEEVRAEPPAKGAAAEILP